MTEVAVPRWEAKRTDDSRAVEAVLRGDGFDRADAYRYNSASIRVRVVDPRFEAMSVEQRDALVDRSLSKLPEEIQADIITLFTFAPSELVQTPKTFRQFLQNVEFEDPSPSLL
jgi:hypothetical protein